MKHKLIGLVLLLACASVLGACGNSKFKADYSLEIPDFEHVNQRGETVSLESLKVSLGLACIFSQTVCRSVRPCH